MRWLPSIPLAAILPCLHILIGMLRFGPASVFDRFLPGFSLGFLYLGSLGATLLATGWFLRSEGRAQRIFTGFGFLAGIPVALITLAILPWFLPTSFACLFGGSLPVILCTFAGYDFGSRSPLA